MATKTINIRGRTLGGTPPLTPLICAPLVGRTRERVLAEAAIVIAKGCDLIEWRVDFFEGIGDTAAALDVAKDLRAAAGDMPIIFTRRSVNEGGEPISIDDADVVRLYEAVCASQLIDFVDFEMGNDADLVRQVIATAHQHETRVILSYHNFSETPSQAFMVQRFMEAERLGGDMAKIAVMPRDRNDVLALLAATALAEETAQIPLISMSMGALGAVTRMIGGEFGSALSFAVGEGSSAPGQLPIADLSQIAEIIRRTRS